MEQIGWTVARATVTLVDTAQLSPPIILSHTDNVVFAVILIAIVRIAAMSDNPPWGGLSRQVDPRKPCDFVHGSPVDAVLRVKRRC